MTFTYSRDFTETTIVSSSVPATTSSGIPVVLMNSASLFTKITDGTNTVSVEISGSDAVANVNNALSVKARLIGFNGTSWDRVRVGQLTVSSSFTGSINTLPWARYNVTPTTRTDGQGGPLEATTNGSIRVAFNDGATVNNVAVELSGVDNQGNSRTSLDTAARLSAYNSIGTWDRVMAGVTLVSSSMTGSINTLPLSVYKTTFATRTDSQGGPLQSDNAGNLATIDKSRDEASGAEKTVELAGPDTKYVTETLVDTLAITWGTYYPSTSGMSMDGYEQLSFTGYIAAGNGCTSSLALEVSNYGGAVATDWMKVYFLDVKNNVTTCSLFTSATTASYTATTASFAVQAGTTGLFPFANIRFNFSGSGAPVDNCLRLATKRLY